MLKVDKIMQEASIKHNNLLEHALQIKESFR